MRTEHPLLGRLAAALKPKQPAVGAESQATKAWETGSVGEERVGQLLNRCPAAYSLHDRAVPGSRANVDHIALGPAAVYVIDAKRYTGRVEARSGRLFVADCNRSRLVEGVQRQVAVVRQALADDAVPVRGVLALWPDRLIDLVSEPGPMTVARTMELARRLATALPPA